MGKKEIKKNLLDTVQQSPCFQDIRWIAVFGSSIHGKSRKDSDVDVLIDFTPQARIGFFKYIQLQQELSDALGRKVDLVTPQALSKFIRDDVLQEAEVIYER